MATPNNFRVKNGLTVSNGVTVSAGNVVITSGQLVIGATAINATSISSGDSNAYSNAVSYTDTKIGTANTAITGNAATAYTNAVSYTDTKIGTANTAITGNAATAYTNAIAIAANGSNITSGTVAFARIPTADSVSNTSISHVPTANNVKTAYDAAITANTNAQTALTAAGSAYSNGVTYTDTKIGTANTAITGNAATAYTNATIFAANASNANNGTLAFARLPSLFIGTTTIQSTSAAQAVSGITTLAAGNTTITGDITVSGNLTINGTTTNINSTNLVVEDKNIILGDVTTPTDLTADGGGITLKGATDKTFNWVNASASWTASEHIDLAAGKVYKIGNTTIANSTALGTGILASSLTSVGTLSSLTVGGISTFNGNVVLGSSGLSANGGFGTATHVLHSNGTAAYWAVDDNTTYDLVAVANTAVNAGLLRLADVNNSNDTVTFTGSGTSTVSSNATHLIINSADQFSGTVTSIVAANGLNGGTITSTGTMSVLGGSTLTVNSVGAHVNSALSITSLTLAGAASGITTLAAGNTTITGFANVTTSIQGGSSLAIAGALSGVTTAAMGNTTITGFANVSTTLQVGGISTLAANLVMANNNITNPVLTGYTEAETANTAATGTFTMNCLASNFFDLTLTGNITISPTNVPPATRVWSGTIAAKQDATGGRTITWPAGTKYAGGVSPPATTNANAVDIWSIMTYDGGTTYIVSLSVKNAS